MGWADGARQDAFVDGLLWALATAAPFVAAMLLLGPPGGGRGPFEREAGALLATARDLLKAGGFGHAPPGIPVGLHGRRVLFRSGDKLLHTLLLGPTGIGKGVSTIVPLLLTWTHSAIVKDPKPELCQRTGRWRSRLGPVHCVKIDDPRSARYNPLLSIRADDGNPSAGPIVTDAQTLAEMLAHAGEPDAHDRFWDDATTLVVTGLLIAARLSPEPTIATFYRMMRGLMVGRVPDCEHPFASSVLRQVWTTWPERTRGSVFVNLEVRLAFLASPLVQAVLSGDDFRADDLQAGPKPVTVYVCTPLVDAGAMRPLHRLLIASLLRPLMYDQKRTLDGRRKLRPVAVVWDEFPADGRIPAFETYAANLRGFDVWLVLAAQDQDAIDRIYGPRNAIPVNCRLRLYSASLSESSSGGSRSSPAPPSPSATAARATAACSAAPPGPRRRSRGRWSTRASCRPSPRATSWSSRPACGGPRSSPSCATTSTRPSPAATTGRTGRCTACARRSGRCPPATGTRATRRS